MYLYYIVNNKQYNILIFIDDDEKIAFLDEILKNLKDEEAIFVLRLRRVNIKVLLFTINNL